MFWLPKTVLTININSSPPYFWHLHHSHSSEVSPLLLQDQAPRCALEVLHPKDNLLEVADYRSCPTPRGALTCGSCANKMSMIASWFLVHATTNGDSQALIHE